MTPDLIKEMADVIKEAIKILGPAIVTAIVGYKVGNLPNC